MRVLLSVVALVVLGGTATAQVNNPAGVAFTSPDHNTIWTPAPGQPGTAVPVVTSYLLEIQEPTGVVVRTTDIGKPVSATGQITALLTQTGLQQNHSYMVVVIVVGPGGSTPSSQAGPFGWFVDVPLPAPAPATNVTLLAEMPTPVPGIAVGSRVAAGSLGVLVRVAPSLSADADPTVQSPGALGTAIGGPTVADGWTWWQVDWDTGADGWCSEGPTFLTVAP